MGYASGLMCMKLSSTRRNKESPEDYPNTIGTFKNPNCLAGNLPREIAFEEYVERFNRQLHKSLSIGSTD